MIFKLTILIILISLLIPVIEVQSSDTEYWNSIIEKTGLKKGEYLVINYYAFGDCDACIKQSRLFFNCIRTNHKDLKVKYLTLVFCTREIELNLFKEKFKWEYPILRTGGKAKKSLGLDINTTIALFDFKGNLLLSGGKNTENFCSDVLAIIN